MNLEQAFAQGLPKWPQLYITGKPVSVEQAKDIIFRTEKFLTSLGMDGGNNHVWNEWARSQMGIRLSTDEMYTSKLSSFVWHLTRAWREENSVQTDYVTIDRASCAFIGGPHGWCDPTGKIYYDDNVGKWPSVKDIYDDLVIIASAFPYVEMHATLYDGESCTDERLPVVTFKVSGGAVELLDFERGDINQLAGHAIQEDTSAGSGEARIHSMMANFHLLGREQGLPDEWIVEFGAKVKAWLPRAAAKVFASIPPDNAKELAEFVKPLLLPPR